MNLDDLYRIFLEKDPDNSYFVDKENMIILSCPTEVLKKVHENLELSEEDKAYEEVARRYLDEKNRYVLVPTLEPYDYLKAKHTFIRESSVEIRKEISGFNDDFEGMNLFIDKITELNLLDTWKKTFEEQVDDSIYLWLLNSHINMFPESQRYNKVFEYMKKIYRLNPWHYFDNEELIKISIGDFNIYLNFNLLDQFYGDFSIYFDKPGLCDFEAINDFDANEDNLMNSFQSCIKCLYLPENMISAESYAILKKSKLEFKTYSPSIELYQEGKVVTNNIDDNNLILLEDVIRIFYAGLLDYIYYPVFLNRQKNEFLNIDVLENDELVLKGFLYQRTGEINDYGFSYEEKETTCLLDDYLSYEVKLDCFKSSLLDPENPVYIYYVIAIDVDKNDVVYYDQSCYQEDKKAVELLKEKLNKFIDEKGFAKNIFVDDYFSYQLIRETVGLSAEVQYQESSYILEDIVDKIHQLEDRSEDEEIKYLS